MNKDLILRERLAIERTDMAIDRTFLSFLRTSLYFAIAGWTIINIIDIQYSQWLGALFWLGAALLLGIGIYKCVQQKKRLRDSKKHIGNYLLEWEES